MLQHHLYTAFKCFICAFRSCVNRSFEVVQHRQHRGGCVLFAVGISIRSDILVSPAVVFKVRLHPLRQGQVFRSLSFRFFQLPVAFRAFCRFSRFLLFVGCGFFASGHFLFFRFLGFCRFVLFLAHFTFAFHLSLPGDSSSPSPVKTSVS